MKIPPIPPYRPLAVNAQAFNTLRTPERIRKLERMKCSVQQQEKKVGYLTSYTKFNALIIKLTQPNDGEKTHLEVSHEALQLLNIKSEAVQLLKFDPKTSVKASIHEALNMYRMKIHKLEQTVNGNISDDKSFDLLMEKLSQNFNGSTTSDPKEFEAYILVRRVLEAKVERLAESVV